MLYSNQKDWACETALSKYDPTTHIQTSKAPPFLVLLLYFLKSLILYLLITRYKMYFQTGTNAFLLLKYSQQLYFYDLGIHQIYFWLQNSSKNKKGKV